MTNEQAPPILPAESRAQIAEALAEGLEAVRVGMASVTTRLDMLQKQVEQGRESSHRIRNDLGEYRTQAALIGRDLDRLNADFNTLQKLVVIGGNEPGLLTQVGLIKNEQKAMQATIAEISDNQDTHLTSTVTDLKQQATERRAFWTQIIIAIVAALIGVAGGIAGTLLAK